MWQRVQTLYLVLAVISVFLAIFFPLFKLSVEDIEMVFDAYGAKAFKDGELRNQKDVPLYFANLLVGILTLITLFLYKNRKKQLLVGRINFFLNIILVIFLFAFTFWGVEIYAAVENIDLPEEVGYTTSVGLGFFFNVAVLPLIFLANLGIKRDEKLVRSLDRLR